MARLVFLMLVREGHLPFHPWACPLPPNLRHTGHVTQFYPSEVEKWRRYLAHFLQPFTKVDPMIPGQAKQDPF